MLEIPNVLWSRLLGHLRDQGAGIRESGAFLLGAMDGASRTISGFLPYETLQRDVLNEGFVSLRAESFSKLWTECRRVGMTVVADVHTHEFGPEQSRSDRANPMIALKGHIALIVPRFAQGRVTQEDIGIHVYHGAHQWTSYFGQEVCRVFVVGG